MSKPLHKITQEEIEDIRNWLPNQETTDTFFKRFPIDNRWNVVSNAIEIIESSIKEKYVLSSM